MKLSKLLVAVILAAGVPSAQAGLKLEYDLKPVAGFGVTTWDGNLVTTCCDSTSAFHVGGGFTLLKLDKSANIGLLGAGAILDFSSFDGHSAELYEANRRDRNDPLSAGTYTNLVVTLIPIRLGPLVYQISLDNNVTTLGLHRGRLQMLTVDVLGAIRLIRSVNGY